MIQEKQRRVYAKFRRGAAPGWAQQIGVDTFPMLDRPPEIDPAAWLCSYDSDADEWNDEERAAIVERLDELGYLRVERPRLKAPYPMYDQHRKTAGRRTVELAVKDIVAAYETAGFDIDHAVAYEQENGNDETVIAALAALRPPVDTVEADPAEDVIVA